MLLTANHVTHDIQSIADQSAHEANRTPQEGPERVAFEAEYAEKHTLHCQHVDDCYLVLDDCPKCATTPLERAQRANVRLGVWLGLAGLAVALALGVA